MCIAERTQIGSDSCGILGGSVNFTHLGNSWWSAADSNAPRTAVPTLDGRYKQIRLPDAARHTQTQSDTASRHTESCITVKVSRCLTVSDSVWLLYLAVSGCIWPCLAASAYVLSRCLCLSLADSGYVALTCILLYLCCIKLYLVVSVLHKVISGCICVA